MGKNFWSVVNGVISESDILLEIIDARQVAETRNWEIEQKVKKEGKTLIYVLNKCDLANRDELEKIKKTLNPSVFISCKEYHGITLLKERILIEGKRMGKPKPKVGVLGYPNMGKSSVINALGGTGKAKTSAISGFTRGKQYIRSRPFYLIDTPGVIPYGEKDSVKNVMTGIKTESKDPEGDLLLVMHAHPGIIESHYNVTVEEDKEETLGKIAVKINCVRKGNLPNTVRASQIILKLLREGDIRT
jgi:ribosome biogenesis GTPase A